jgi:hypothetical protein
VSLLRRAAGWMFRGAAPAQPQATNGMVEPAEAGTARRLVRDPVCGVHVAEVLSIPLREGTETLHFCSIVCRDQYMNGGKKLAANG